MINEGRVLQFKPPVENGPIINAVDTCLWCAIVLCGVLVIAIGRFMVLDVLSVLR